MKHLNKIKTLILIFLLMGCTVENSSLTNSTTLFVEQEMMDLSQNPEEPSEILSPTSATVTPIESDAVDFDIVVTQIPVSSSEAVSSDLTDGEVKLEETPPLPIYTPESVSSCNIEGVKNLTGRILFETSWDGNSELYYLTLPSKEISRITNSIYIDERSGQWFPNGQKIAFISSHFQNSAIEFKILDLSTGNQSTIVPSDQRPFSPFSFTKDNSYIAYTSNAGSVIYNSILDEQRFINQAGDISLRFPTFSPDQMQLAFLTAMNTNQTRWRIVIQDLSSGERKIIDTSSFSDDYLVWHPTENKIVFVSSSLNEPNQSQLYIYDVSRNILQGLNSSEGLKSNLTISPNGEWLAYSSIIWEFDEQTEQSVIKSRSIDLINLNTLEIIPHLYQSENLLAGIDWSTNSRSISFIEHNSDRKANLLILDICDNTVQILVEEINPYQKPDWGE